MPTQPTDCELTPLEKAAAAWIEDHPEEMREYERQALACYAKGLPIGISAITETIRWSGKFKRHDGQEFAVPNNHRAYIARELLRRVPSLIHTITMAKTKAQNAALRQQRTNPKE
jgi:hypothetical protein